MIVVVLNIALFIVPWTVAGTDGLASNSMPVLFGWLLTASFVLTPTAIITLLIAGATSQRLRPSLVGVGVILLVEPALALFLRLVF